MKVVLCLVAASLAVVYAKYNIVAIPPEHVPRIVEASSKCIREMKLDQDILQKYLAWELVDSESTRKYMFCLGTDSGYFTDDGSMIKDEVLKVVGNHKDKVAGIIDECNKSKYNDKYETLYNIVICFRDKSGLQFKV